MKNWSGVVIACIIILIVITAIAQNNNGSGNMTGLVAMLKVNSSVTTDVNMSTATTTQIVALSGSNYIRFSYHLMAAGTTNVSIVYGTGTNCGSGTTTIDGPLPLTAQTGMVGNDEVIPPGNALCILNGSASQIGGEVSWTYSAY
jgi:hypothetical protein